MSTCHCIISHNFTINRWFSHEFPILSCPDSPMYRKTMVSGPPLGVFAVSSWLCSPSHWRPPPLFAQNSLEIHGMKKNPWANEPPKAQESLRELLEEHVILTRCSNGLIYYGNRHRKPLFLASKIKLTLQERPWRHLQECPWRQFWALQIDKIGMSRGNCSSSSRGTFFLLSCGAP